MVDRVANGPHFELISTLALYDKSVYVVLYILYGRIARKESYGLDTALYINVRESNLKVIVHKNVTFKAVLLYLRDLSTP